jgi:RNA polymerase-binding transcription factor DksA
MSETASPATASPAPIDLDGIERDLAAVETALQRLDAGTYWTDEVTGETIADEVLAVDPTARRVGPTASPIG